jgi:hypothetical protein
MPALDLYHNAVKNALLKDSWTITHDTLHIKWGKKDMYVDLGAKRILTAEREEQKIAVEVKSFISDSEMDDLKNAIGQFTIYRSVLRKTYPEHILYLAVRDITYESLFTEPIGQLMIEDEKLKLIVFDSSQEVILQWIH